MPLSPDLDALVRGQHSDPFRLLGPHVDAVGGPLRIRYFRPGVTSVQLQLRHPAQVTLAMTRRHMDGLFEVDVPAVASLDDGVDYRLLVEFE